MVLKLDNLAQKETDEPQLHCNRQLQLSLAGLEYKVWTLEA